ncbi:MAG: hypothetical protein LBK23_04615 [Oscillospiraceae bacterium]|jgi:hypothetical protein|nr:hypothetical protein [Oscillospiraceae bacterium]
MTKIAKSELGTISRIEEVYEVKRGYGSMDGYKVATDKTEIFVLIDNAQDCCERWGYITSEDDFSPYIGAELRQIVLTDTALNIEYVEKSNRYGFDEGGIQFVDFQTSNGVFQLAVYNSHNGYYGHGIVILIGDDVIHEDVL